MKRTTQIFLFLLCTICALRVDAQQEPMYTKYMFNSLVTNPGYAGSLDYLSVRVLHRQQWIGIDGGPLSQTLTVHSPFKKRVGIGLSIGQDKVGSTGSTMLNGIYTYKVPFGTGNLAIGMQGGVMNWRSDFSDLVYRDDPSRDEVFADMGYNLWLPNFGAGLYYSNTKFYLGFSVPRLLSWDLRNQGSSDEWAKTYRHYYISAGGIIPIKGKQVMFKPSILVKTVGLLGEFSTNVQDPQQIGAPAEFDVDLSFLFYEALWVGASFRSAFAAEAFGGKSSFDSADIWASYYLRNGMRVGISYDYTLSKLNDFTKGTYEVMLGYDFVYNSKRIITPRYF